MKRRIPPFPILALAGVLASTGAEATLIGDSITGTLIDRFGSGPTIPFTSQQVVVGAGIEFTGQWSVPPFGQVWEITVDVAATSLTVSAFEITTSVNNIVTAGRLIEIRLEDLDIGGSITSVTQSAGGNGVSSIAFTDDSIAITWNALPFGAGNAPPNGGSWTFDIGFDGSPRGVDEPGALALSTIGIASLAFARRRKRRQ